MPNDNPARPKVTITGRSSVPLVTITGVTMSAPSSVTITSTTFVRGSKES